MPRRRVAARGRAHGLERTLAVGIAGSHDRDVWRRAEAALDRETVDGIILKLMSIDDKLEQLVDELLEDDGQEETDS